MRQHYFKMSIELPATFIHRYSDMTEKLLKAVLNSTEYTQTHTLLPFSFIQKIGIEFARNPFDTVPHKSRAINIDFPLLFGIYMCFPVFWLLSGISVLSGLYIHRKNGTCFCYLSLYLTTYYIYPNKYPFTDKHPNTLLSQQMITNRLKTATITLTVFNKGLIRHDFSQMPPKLSKICLKNVT